MSVLGLSSDDYHADQTGDQPSLSSSIAKELYFRTPAHARELHPRLAQYPRAPKESPALDMGTAVHQILLKDDRIDVGDFADYRTVAAREWRDSVRAADRVPMLADKWQQAHEVAQNIRRSVATMRPVPFTEGQPEVSIAWVEMEARLRARVDYLRNDHAVIWDLKTTGRSADSRTFERQIFNYGYDIQADMYCRAVESLSGSRPIYEWIAVEVVPPYGVTRHRLSDEAQRQAAAKVDMAISLWKDCLAKNEWPGYPSELNVVYPPAWARDTSDAWEGLTIDLDAGAPF